jgi:iron complex transport system substrate-binding protein
MTGVPARIICLSAEAADWLWRIGAWDQIVGVTAFFNQPPSVQPHPRVSGFSTAHQDRIEALEPDLIITFSDVQAKLAESLIKLGYPVLATNQRTLRQVEQTLALLGRVTGRETQSKKLLNEFRSKTAPVRREHRRPRVYFEEWSEPMISGIAWVSELIERAGGADIFEGLRSRRAASERIVSSESIIQADPEIILASWCGKPIDINRILDRPGWHQISAARRGRIFEISSDDILQPGFRLLYGYEQICQIISREICSP